MDGVDRARNDALAGRPVREKSARNSCRNSFVRPTTHMLLSFSVFAASQHPDADPTPPETRTSRRPDQPSVPPTADQQAAASSPLQSFLITLEKFSRRGEAERRLPQRRPGGPATSRRRRSFLKASSRTRLRCPDRAGEDKQLQVGE